MSNREKIIRDASIYSSAAILTQLVTLVAGILTRRFLGPVQTGVWALLQVILVYSNYALLGAAEAVHREIPFYLGKGDQSRAEEIKNLVFSFSLITSLAISAGLIVYAVFFRGTLSPEIYIGLLFLSSLVVLQRISNLMISLVRCYKNFFLASKHMLFSAVINAALVALLSSRFKIYGFLWAMILSFIFNIAYLGAHHRFSFSWNLKWSRIYELIRYGFPLMIVAMLGSLFLTIDKLMIAKWLGLRELGIYSVALLAYAYLGNLPNALGNVMIPNFHEKFGRTEQARDLKGYLSQSTRVFCDIMPILIGAVWFGMPYLAKLVLPEFKESILPMKYLIVSAYFLALTSPFGFFLVVIRRQLALFPIMSAALVLAFLFNYFAIHSGLGLCGVGGATTGVLFIKFSAMFWMSSTHAYTRREAIREYSHVLLKFVFMLATLLLLDIWLPLDAQSLSGSIVRLAAFILVYAPFLIRLNRDMRILSSLRNAFLGRFFSPAQPQE